jgi:hypothetical protein
MSARDDYIRNLYGGSSSSSSSGSSTGTSGGAVGGYTPPSGGGSGTNYGSNVGTSGVGTNVSGIADTEHYKYITDPKLDEDAGVYEANQDVFDYLGFRLDDKDESNAPFTSPQDTYASDLNFITVDPETVQKMGLLDELKDKYAISDETLKFYGVDPSNPATLPIELYQMLAEGSIVTSMEAMNPAQIKARDKDGNVIFVDENVGTFSDLKAGVHPLLGSIDKYYGIMSGSAFPQPATGGDGGRINVGGSGDYGAGIAAGLGRRPKQLGDEEGIPKGLRLLQYMVNLHKENPYTKMAIRKKNGGIVSLVGG